MSTSRRALRRATMSVAVIGSLVLVPGSPQVDARLSAAPAPDVTCATCIVMTAGGRVLWARSAAVPRPNASTTKMVTAMVVRAESDIGDQVTVGPTAAATGGGGLDLRAGDVLSVEDLLYGLLLSSSNDAAVALAEHVAGSEQAFVTRMERLARDLGARRTNFVTAHGLDMPGHVSTARDLALIGAALLDDPVLARIVATPGTTISGPRGPQRLENRNLLLHRYRGAVGIKTGFTAGAGNVLVAAARRHRRTLIAVAMGAVDATADAAALLDHGFSRLRRSVLVRRGQEAGTLYWAGGTATRVLVDGTVRGPYRPDLVRLHLTVSHEDPVAAGDVVGTVEVVVGRRTIATLDAITADTVEVVEGGWGTDALAWVIRAAATIAGRA